MGAPYPGGCVCGATRYRLTAEPLTLYACHCTDCQKRSGSAFGLSMWVRRDALELTQGEITRHRAALADGRVSNARLCARCGTRLWSEPERHPELAVVRPGTLDDTSGLEPVAHIWTRSAQPWFRFPEGVATYDTQPPDTLELAALWQSRRRP
jgi:hypothetical protein